MRVLLDSGILLRLVNPFGCGPRNRARRLASVKAARRFVVTAAQNIAEFWNVCTRPASARGGYGLSVAETERRVRLLERLFPVLTEIPAAYPLWRNLVVAHGVQGVQVHDVRLVALLQAHGITHIITLNGADFARYPGVVALHPTAVP